MMIINKIFYRGAPVTQWWFPWGFCENKYDLLKREKSNKTDAPYYVVFYKCSK